MRKARQYVTCTFLKVSRSHRVVGLLDQNLREGPRSGRVILTSEGYDFQSVRISENLPTVGPALVSLLLGWGMVSLM